MIDRYVKIWDEHKDEIKADFVLHHPTSYLKIVEKVIRLIAKYESSTRYYVPDANKIHVIDDGEYQGTLLFIIPADTYQPDEYWYVKVGYGSCSGCDTLEGIREYSDDLPSPEQVEDYMLLALHILQGIKEM
jgi:hypothetical protein